MIETLLPPVPDFWATVPAPAPAPLLEQVATLRLENAVLCVENAALQAETVGLRAETVALRAQNAALQERIRELEAQLGQNSSNSSRPPSADPPQAPVRPKAARSSRKRGGQPG